jgi:threonine aldolase
LYEQGGIAQIGGVHPRHLPNNSDGTIDPSDIEEAIREDDPHFPVTRLICLENTHNHNGGRVLSLQYMRKVKEIADKHGIALHLDGARVMNAAASLGVSPASIAEHTDTVSFCLSKALGAPIGSVIVGKRDFIHRCHRLRKALGGQLRQVGILAAPGLIALKTMPSLLGRDHDVAKYLGRELNCLEGLSVDLETIDTNMVVVHLSDAHTTEGLTAALKAAGFLIAAMGKQWLRLVTHHQITQSDAERVVQAFQKECSKL